MRLKPSSERLTQGNPSYQTVVTCSWVAIVVGIYAVGHLHSTPKPALNLVRYERQTLRFDFDQI